jgi:hypothetical protein
VFAQKPQPTVALAPSDEIAAWITKLDRSNSVQVSASDPTTGQVESFQFSLSSPWPLVFDSTPKTLASAFGSADAESIKSGLDAEGFTLTCGLNLAKTPSIPKLPLEKLYQEAGLSAVYESLPVGLKGLTVTLDTAKSKEKRNALWFTPTLDFRTALRLQFRVDLFQELQRYLNSAVKGLRIAEADVIFKPAYLRSTMGGEATVVEKGEVYFTLECSVQANSGAVVNMTLGVEFSTTSIMLSVVWASEDPRGGIFAWLGELISDDLGGTIDGFLDKDTAISSAPVFLRRLQITIDTGQAGVGPMLANFGLDIELGCSFCCANKDESAAFLLSYKWSNIEKGSGTLYGMFWSGYTDTSQWRLEFRQEKWTVLRPVSSAKPVTSIDLVRIIPGVTIEKLPDCLPTSLTRASLQLSSEGFGFAATLEAKSPPAQGRVPQPALGRVQLNASYSWGANDEFSLGVNIFAMLYPSKTSKHQSVATLGGNLAYLKVNGTRTWKLDASLQGLYLSSLAEFFDNDTSNVVMPMLESIEIDKLDVSYDYKSAKTGPEPAAAGAFSITGVIFAGPLELDLEFLNKDTGAWEFTAMVRPDGVEAKVGEVLDSILGDDDLDLPDFLADIQFIDKNSNLELRLVKGPTGQIAFNLDLDLPKLSVSLTQHTQKAVPQQGNNVATPAVVSRLLKVSYSSFPTISDLPVIGTVAPTFEEFEFLWANRDIPSLVVDDLNSTVYIEEEEKLLTKAVVAKEGLQQTPAVALIKGCHFLIIGRKDGQRQVMLDYTFAGNRTGNTQPPPLTTTTTTTTRAAIQDTTEDSTLQPVDGEMAVTPINQKQGPLSIKNMAFGVSTKEKSITVSLDAVFQLGPVGFALLGLSLTLANIGDWENLAASGRLEGMSVSYVQDPIVMAGAFRRSVTKDSVSYAGAMALTFPPYRLAAMGSYSDTPFTSLFVLAALEGPLAQLEVAEISGVTVGFGYNSDLKIPSAAEVNSHPFLDPLKAAETFVQMKSGENPWYPKRLGSNWLAAGLTVKAMQTLSIQAVLAVQFGAGVQISVFAKASAQAPANVGSKSVKPFVNVNMGIIGVLNVDKGILKVEGQLASSSYILDESCKLVGGFALAYWFKGSEYEGDWVFSIGGYHPAYSKPSHYPAVSSPMGISWNYSSEIQIQGGAYFAATPLCLMGGGRLSAIFRKNNMYGVADVDVRFRAWADFLINYHPFHYAGEAGASIDGKVKVDGFFLTATWRISLSGSLRVQGPPFSGVLTVRGVPVIKKMTVSFGARGDVKGALEWDEFTKMVLQSDTAGAHIISLAEGSVDGIASDADTSQSTEGGSPKQPQAIVIRAGDFKLNVQTKFPASRYTLQSEVNTVEKDLEKTVYFKPMKSSSVTSNLMLFISGAGSDFIDDDSMTAHESKVPSAIWGKCMCSYVYLFATCIIMLTSIQTSERTIPATGPTTLAPC